MPTVREAQLRGHNRFLSELHTERSQWESLWQELSNNYLPQRYRWLMSAKEYYANRARRQYIINNTGTRAARILAAGMMNGVTSPSRPWFKLRVPGIELESHRSLAIWLEEVERRLLRIMAESNFYNSMAVMYLDMCVFGTAVQLIYEDAESVIRCYNPPLGEFYIAGSDRGTVNKFGRKFTIKVHQYIERWPDERYWSDRVKTAVRQGKEGSSRDMNLDVEISHFIAPNHDKLVPERFPYYELYWETRRTESRGIVLEKRGFNEMPGVFGRWEVSGTEPYGVSPAMDVLGDNIELQHLHRQKAQLLEKMHKPPIMADIALSNNPIGLQPGGKTFVPGLDNSRRGVIPIFDVDPRFQEINVDQLAIERRIHDTFYNFLFTGITDLDKVKSATEIDAREGEKLILLGGVLERFESESLDPAISRIYSISDRAGLLPPPPSGYDDVPLEIQYVSILSIAQRAAGTAPTERALAVIGNTFEGIPQILDIPDFDRMFTNYFRDIGLRNSEIRDPEEIAAARQAREAPAQAEGQLAAAETAAGAGKTLSEIDVGGGANALQRLIG